MALQHLILSAQYFRTFLMCAVVSFVVGLAHTLFLQTTTWFHGGSCHPYGAISSPHTWISSYYGTFIDPDDAAMILVFTVWAILPFHVVFRFEQVQDAVPTTMAARIKRFYYVWRRHIVLALALLSTSPAWEWCLIRPVLRFYNDLRGVVTHEVAVLMENELWRIQELWCLVIVPIIILPIIYVASGAQPRRKDAFLSDDATVVETTQNSGAETLLSIISHLVILVVPRSFRGNPSSSLYAITLFIGIFWWSTYVPEFFSVSGQGDSYWVLLTFAQRGKIAIVMLFTLGVALTTSYRRCMGHIAYVIAIAFLFPIFPFSLSIAIDYWFHFYIDQTQPWLERSTLLIMFYVISVCMNYMLRMITRSTLPISIAAALIFGWSFFEDTLGDLTFLELGPTSILFWISATLLVMKTIIRDLDVPSDILYYLQQRYLMFFNANVDGTGINDEIQCELKQRYLLWRQQYDRILMRHQNFLAECSSKIAVITAITFETALLGNHQLYNPTIPWVVAYLPMRSAAARVELLSGLIILWLLQVITHFGILVYLHRVDRSRRAAIQRVQDTESGYDIQQQQQQQRPQQDPPVSIELKDLKSVKTTVIAMSDDDFTIYIHHMIHHHWSNSTLCYLMCIITFFYCAISTVISNIRGATVIYSNPAC